MSTFKSIGLFAAVTALLAVTASPAQAVPYQPNGKIKAQGDAAFLGNDVYNTDGTGQSVGTVIDHRGVAKFVIKVQNDGTKRDKLIVNLVTLDYDGGWKTNLYRGQNDVSFPATGNGYKTRKLAPGESVKLVLREKNTSTDPVDGHFIDELIEIDSKNDGDTVVDVVLASAAVQL